jgi:acetyl esterase/lipase
MDDKAKPSSLVVPQREVPWPAAISAAARESLIAMEMNKAWVTFKYPDPKDKEAWRAFVKQVDAALIVAQPMYALAERPGIRSETRAMGSARVHISTPEKLSPYAEGRVYMEIHGGGLVFVEGEGCRRGSLFEAERLGVRVVSVDYRMPPDHPYPAALDDCMAVYRELLKTYKPGQIIAGGQSGGGNLAAAFALRARDEGLPPPAGLVLLTPEVDLTESGDTFNTLHGIDPVLLDKLSVQIQAYAPGQDLSHPYLSPLFGDFTRGFPPTFLQSGTRDMFLSNTVRMHRRLRNAGIEAELHVWEAMPHGGFFAGPEDAEISAEMRRFFDSHWLA